MAAEYQDDLKKLARRLNIITESVRVIHVETGLPSMLASALGNLTRAEAQILEAASQ